MDASFLYDYQHDCLNQIRDAYRSGKRKPLLVSATGSGKTVMFSVICKGAMMKGSRVTILVHRQELIDQVSETLRKFDVPHGKISPEYSRQSDHLVQVASVFTLARRLPQTRPPDLLIIDEAHHAIPDSTWGKCIAAFPQVRLLGTTATPIRLSGQGLGDTFDSLVLGPPVQSLIDRGRLSAVDVYAPPSIDMRGAKTRMGEFAREASEAAADRPSVTGDAIEHYHKHASGKRAAVFCTSIVHATHIAAQANASGITAVMIDGNMDRTLRRDVVKDFSENRIKWLVTVDLISEGFDCPGIEVGISLRPTQSLGLWLQQCGRILRTHPGKERAIILDHAGNTLRHGLPTEARDWSLSGARKGRKGLSESSPSVRVCAHCFAAFVSGQQACPDCGTAVAVKPRTVARRAGTLEKITPEEAARIKERQKTGATKTRDGLIELGRLRGYKNAEGWADHVMGGRRGRRTVSTKQE